jgi:RNA polymerase sigma-70 factor (ECF subfamily)
MHNAIPLAGDAPVADEWDETAFIRAAQAHPPAFAPLYDHYLPRVYRYVRARVAGADEAADLTQEIFLRALTALPAYRMQGVPFAAWLFRIARNAVTDAHRRRRPTWSIHTLLGWSPPAEEGDPEDAVLHEEALRRLRALVLRLDEAKQELLTLRFADGLTAPEIALVTGRSEAAVKKQLSRTLIRLKEHYHAE